MGKHPSRFYICLESKQQHKLRGHWASPALLCPHRNRPLVCTAKAGPVHLSLCSQPAQVHCKAVRSSRVSTFQYKGKFHFSLRLGLGDGLPHFTLSFQNKGLFIHLPDFIHPTQEQSIKGIGTSCKAPVGSTAKACSSLPVSALQENRVHGIFL